VLKNGSLVADGPKAAVLTADLLSEVYGTRLRLQEVEGHFLVYPAGDT
jgi:ABC-type cobalamin transport system ATPase subunit